MHFDHLWQAIGFAPGIDQRSENAMLRAVFAPGHPVASILSSWQQCRSEAEVLNMVLNMVPMTSTTSIMSMPMCPVPQGLGRSRLENLSLPALQACAGASSLSIFVHSRLAQSVCDHGACASCVMIDTENNCIDLFFFTDFLFALLVGLAAFE